MITAIVVAAFLLVGYVGFKKLLQVAKVYLGDILSEIKKERDIIKFEKNKVEQGLVELTMAADRAEKATVTARLVQERMSDPKWMNRFNDGRENAKWN